MTSCFRVVTNVSEGFSVSISSPNLQSKLVASFLTLITTKQSVLCYNKVGQTKFSMPENFKFHNIPCFSSRGGYIRSEGLQQSPHNEPTLTLHYTA
jgi:hypothetical protein